jgi:hypothetical protein
MQLAKKESHADDSPLQSVPPWILGSSLMVVIKTSAQAIKQAVKPSLI